MAVRQGKLTLQRMIELYESGMDTAEIAEQNGYQNDKFIIHKLRMWSDGTSTQAK